MIVLDGLRVRVADRLERVRAGRAGSGGTERVERPCEAVVDDGDEELLLRPEEAEEVGLRDARAARDRVGGRAVEPAQRELDVRGLEDGDAPFVCRLSWGRGLP